MASDPFAKVDSGDPLRIPADVYNTLMDVAREYLDGQHDQSSRPRGLARRADVIKIRNDSGSAKERFSVLKLNGVGITEIDNLEEFQNGPLLLGITPTTTTDNVAVLIEPANTDEFARAIISGIVPVQVNVTDAAHGFANPTVSDATQLTSGASGLHRILYKPDGTGTKWCLVRVGEGSAVTSVAMTVPSVLSVAGSPITTAGTLDVTLATETANTVFAGPTSGGAATPTFRSLAVADLPTSSLRWIKFTRTFADFTAAATTQTILIATQIGKDVYHEMIIKHSVAFAGGGLTAFGLMMRYNGTNMFAGPDLDAFQAPTEFLSLQQTTNQTDPVQVIFTPTTRLFELRATSTGANVNAATAGSVDIWLLISALP